MSALSTLKILKAQGYRDTQPRRMVLAALEKAKKPLSPYAIHQWIKARGWTTDIVTVHRILGLLETHALVHRHDRGEAFSLCPSPGSGGHHLSLRCTDCGSSSELHADGLCGSAKSLAKKVGFTPLSHLSELLGRCASCSR